MRFLSQDIYIVVLEFSRTCNSILLTSSSISFCFVFFLSSLVLSLSIVPHHQEQIITRRDCAYGSVQFCFSDPDSWELQQQQPEINLKTQNSNHWVLCSFSCLHFQPAKPRLYYLQMCKCDRADWWVNSGFIQSWKSSWELKKQESLCSTHIHGIYQRRWDLTFEIYRMCTQIFKDIYT